jgi:DNA-binding MarR family transcriptional regulator
MIGRHDVAMGLRMAYWAMHRHTDACLARRGVTANQFVLLALLVERDGITQQELVRRAASDPNTIRAMLVLLENRRLVARDEHPRDSRALRVTLTGKGRRMHERLWADTESVRQRLLDVLNPEETDTLVKALARVAEVMVPSPAGQTIRPRFAGNDAPAKKRTPAGGFDARRRRPVEKADLPRDRNNSFGLTRKVNT